MPPKGDEKKKGPSKPECIPPIVVEALTDASLAFYLNQIADYGYRVERYQVRYEQLLDNRDSLRRQNDRLLAKKAQTINAAKRKLSAKVEELRQYRLQIATLEETIAREKAEFDEKMEQIRLEHYETETRMRAENDILIKKIQSLEYFKTMRDELLKTIANLERELVEQTEKHKREAEEAARKRIVGKNKLKRDILNKLTDEAGDFKRLAEHNLPQPTRRLLLENYKMNSRLLSISQDMIDLGIENKHLDWQKLNQLDRIQQCRVEEAKFTHKNVANQKLINMLAEQRNQLQAALNRIRSRKLPPPLQKVVANKETEVVKSREKLQVCSTENMELKHLVSSSHHLLTERMIVRRRLEAILQSVAWALKSAMASDQDPECFGSIYNPMPESRRDIVESFLRVLDSACHVHVGPTMTDIVSPQKLVSQLNRADRIVSSFSLCYQPGDLGLVPRQAFHVATSRDHVKQFQLARERENNEMIARPKKTSDPYNYVRLKFFEDLPESSAPCPRFNIKDLFPAKQPVTVHKRLPCEVNTVDLESYQVTGISLIMRKD